MSAVNWSHLHASPIPILCESEFIYMWMIAFYYAYNFAVVILSVTCFFFCAWFKRVALWIGGSWVCFLHVRGCLTIGWTVVGLIYKLTLENILRNIWKSFLQTVKITFPTNIKVHQVLPPDISKLRNWWKNHFRT